MYKIVKRYGVYINWFTVLLFILKLAQTINWSWLVVFAPSIVFFAAFFISRYLDKPAKIDDGGNDGNDKIDEDEFTPDEFM